MTLYPSLIITDTMSYSNVDVTSSQAAGQGFVPIPSIDVPPMTVEVTGPDGKTTIRTLSLSTVAGNDRRTTHRLVSYCACTFW